MNPHPGSRSRWLWAGGLALGAICAAGVLVFAAGRPAHVARQSPAQLRLASAPAPVAVARPTPGEVAAAANTFGILRQPATRQDSLPANSAYGSGVARRTGATLNGATEWIVVTQGQVCATATSTTGPAASGPAACNALATLNEPNQLLVDVSSSDQSPSEIIFGIAPDGASSVTIHFSSGKSIIAPVIDNGFASEASKTEQVSGFTWSVGGVTETEG